MGHFVRLLLSIVLIVLTVPFLAVSFLLAAVCATAASVLPRFERRQPGGANALGRPQAADQFGFENALGAYEDLIGAAAWKRP